MMMPQVDLDGHSSFIKQLESSWRKGGSSGLEEIVLYLRCGLGVQP